MARFHSERASGGNPASVLRPGPRPRGCAGEGGRPVPGLCPGGGGGRGQQQGRGGRTPSVGVSKHPFLISCDKRGGAPDLWAHFTGH